MLVYFFLLWSIQMQGVTNEMVRDTIDKFEPVKECKESARIGIDGQLFF